MWIEKTDAYSSEFIIGFKVKKDTTFFLFGGVSEVGTMVLRKKKEMITRPREP